MDQNVCIEANSESQDNVLHIRRACFAGTFPEYIVTIKGGTDWPVDRGEATTRVVVASPDDLVEDLDAAVSYSHETMEEGHYLADLEVASHR